MMKKELIHNVFGDDKTAADIMTQDEVAYYGLKKPTSSGKIPFLKGILVSASSESTDNIIGVLNAKGISYKR